MADDDLDISASAYQDQQDRLDAAETAATPAPTVAPYAGEDDTPIANGVANQPKGPAGLSHLQELIATRRAAVQAKRDAFDPTKFKAIEGGAAIAVPPPPPKTSALGDFGRQSWISAMEMGQQAVGAASLAARQLGADPDTVLHIEEQKARLADETARWVAKLSPEAADAMHASIFGGKDAHGEDVKTPGQVGYAHYAGAAIAGLVPQVALAVLPGGIVGKVVTKAAGGVAGAVAQVGVTAGAFGTLDAGAFYNEIVEQVDKATPAQLMRSPVYAELIKNNVSDVEARKQMIQIIAPSFAATRFGVGAVAGAGIGTLATKGAMGAAGRGALGRMGIGAAEGAATMGGQAGADDALGQVAGTQAGTQGQFDPSQTAKAFAGGALGGALLGVGGGLLHGGRGAREGPVAGTGEAPGAVPAPAETIRPPGTVGAAETAALKGALRTPDPLAGQGEMLPERAPSPESTPAPTPVPAPVEAPRPAPLPGQGELAVAAREPAPGPALAPTPTEPVTAPTTARTTAQVQREDGVGFNEAYRRSQAEAMEPIAPTVAEPRAVEPAAPPAKAPPTLAEQLIAFKRDAQATTGGTVPAPIGRSAMIDALIAGGVEKKGLSSLKAPELRDRLVDLHRNEGKAAPEPKAEPAPVAPPEPAKPVPVSKAVIATEVDAPVLKAAEPKPAKPARVEAAAPAVEGTLALKPGTKPAVEAAVKTARQLAKEKRTFVPEKKVAGYVAPDVAEAAPPVRAAKAADARTHAEVTGDMRAAFGAVKVEPLAKGKEAAVLARALREVEALVGKAPKTEAGVHDAVRAWGASSTEPLPGSRTRRKPVADQVMRLLTGKAEESRMAGEARRHTEASVFEKDGTAHTREATDRMADDAREDHVTEGKAVGAAEGEGEGTPSQGVTNYDATEKGRAAGSNTRRVADDLLAKVLDGELSVHEAHAALGHKEAGTRGRDRAVADFGAHLDERIAHARDKTIEAGLLRRMAETSNDTKMTAKEKEVATKEIARLVEETGEEHAARLQELRDQLDDPVGHAVTELSKPATVGENRTGKTANLDAETRGEAAERAEDLAAYKHDASRTVVGADGVRRIPEAPRANLRQASHDGIAASASRYVQMAADPRVNADVARAMVASEKYDVPFTSRDLLRTIVNSGIAKTELRPLRELAARLLKIAPDIEVMTPARAAERGLPVPKGDFLGAAVRDADGRPSHILLRDDMAGEASQHIEVALHEILHSVTARHLDAEIAKGGRDAKVLGTIGREIADHAPSGFALQMTGLDPAAVLHALKDPHELHTMLMSNPSLQAMLARMPASERFRSEMRDLGYAPREPGRSTWRYFTDWVRRALGMDKAGSGSEQALLDHLLRPAQDITDRAAAYNRLVHDPVVRSMGEPLLRSMGGTLGDRAREAAAWTRIDWAGLNDKSRRLWLLNAPTDAIVSWNRKLFDLTDRTKLLGSNPLERFNQANEAIAHATKVTHEKYADRAATVAQGLAGKEGPALGSLMNDATLAGVRLGRDDAANAHLKKPEQQAERAALEARFAKLSPEGRATYEAARDLHGEMSAEARRARLTGLVRAVLPDATPAQHAAVEAALANKTKREAFLKTSDSDLLAAEFGAKWITSRSLVRSVAKLHAMGYVPGDYFPLRRFGEYLVRYGKGDAVGVEHFESRAVANARVAELRALKVDDLSDVYTKREHAKDAQVGNSVVDQLEASMARQGFKSPAVAAVRDLMNGILLDAQGRSEAARTVMRRKGVLGANENAARVLAQEYLSHGNRMGPLLHGAERQLAEKHMGMVVEDHRMHSQGGEAVTARAVLGELQKRMVTGDDATGALSGALRKATTLGYVQQLMSFSHIVVNTMQAHAISVPMLGARHGAGKASFALTKALSEIAPRLVGKGVGNTWTAGKAMLNLGRDLKAADWNLGHLARDQLIKNGANKAHMMALDAELSKSGLIDHTINTEMKRIAQPGLAATVVGRTWGRFMDLNAAATHSVDVANKWAIAKAAHDLEFSRSKDAGQARAYAIQMVRDTSPNFNTHNKARMATAAGPLGAFAAPVMQFKQFGSFMYGVLANLTRESMHGATPEAKREARKALAGVLATHAAMAGGLSLIADPLRYIGGAYDFATGADRPHDYQNDLRGFLADTFGIELAELFSRGLPHMAGIDLHRRVGLNDMMAVPPLESFDKKGVLKMMGVAMTGASPEAAATMVQGMTKLMRGDVVGGSIDLVPRVVRDPLKALRLADKGIQDSRGKTILPAAKISGWDVAAQAAGFQPSKVSEFREGRQAVYEAKQEATGERGQLQKAWVDAEPADRATAMAAIRVFNQAHPGMQITVPTLIKALQAKQTGATTVANFGLHLPPKAAAALNAHGRFAPQ